MRATILDGRLKDDRSLDPVFQALLEELKARAWETQVWSLSAQEADGLPEAVTSSQLMVFFTPVTFGGYSSALKKGLDRLVLEVAPYYTRLLRESLRRRPAGHFPALLAVGVLPAPEPGNEAIFKVLVARNALSLYPPSYICNLVYSRMAADELHAHLGLALNAVTGGELTRRSGEKTSLYESASGSSGLEGTSGASQLALAGSGERFAFLIVGSQREKSTSAVLGRALLELLAQRGWQTASAQSPGLLAGTDNQAAIRWESLLASYRAADLVILSSPLYVDTLPAGVTGLLERLHAAGATRPGKTSLLAISNCGFPEAHFNATALAIYRRFAAESQLGWAGGLAMGESLAVDGRPLSEAGGMVRGVIQALNLTAQALDHGQPVPTEAMQLMARPFMPTWLYRLLGRLGWHRPGKA